MRGRRPGTLGAWDETTRKATPRPGRVAPRGELASVPPTLRDELVHPYALPSPRSRARRDASIAASRDRQRAPRLHARLTASFFFFPCRSRAGATTLRTAAKLPLRPPEQHEARRARPVGNWWDGSPAPPRARVLVESCDRVSGCCNL